MHLPEALIWITFFGGFTVKYRVKPLKNCSKFVFLQNLIICFLFCPYMTAMPGDRGGGGATEPPTSAWIRWLNISARLGLRYYNHAQLFLEHSVFKILHSCSTVFETLCI